jgi:Mlc titration factor MtfA (ptsG expression regulator)
MNRLLIIWFLVISTVPLYAQAQQPNTAKLKADAEKVVSDIRGDKAKTQAYCQINNLGGQMVEAAQDKDSKKAETLFQRVDDLETQLGPQYRALFDALYDADPNSKDVQDILSMFESLDESCGH